MNGLGAFLLIGLGAVLLIGGARGTLLTAAHQIATPIPASPLSILGTSSGPQTTLTAATGPGPGAPGSGVTTQ